MPPAALLTSADGPVVAPGGQRLGDPLAGDALGALQHVVVLAGELHVRTDPAQHRTENSPSPGEDALADAAQPCCLVLSDQRWP